MVTKSSSFSFAATTSRSASSSFTFLSRVSIFFMAFMATSDVRELTLYGALTLFMSWMMSGGPMQNPNRMPARPKALLRVCRTTTLGYLLTSSEALPWAEKST